VHLEKQFDVKCSPQTAAEIAARDETLTSLFPDAETEIVERDAGRRTTRTRYTALGRSGTATFHFTFRDDGDVDFEKVCDGNVWRELRGRLSFRARGERTRVRIAMDGRTRSLVPEFTIKGAMQDQIEQMASALRETLREV
jgi:YD repeat-containing protein